MDAKQQPNIFVVSNRLPVRVKVERGEVTAVPSAGGLAAALRAAAGIAGWIGWPGTAVASTYRPRVTELLAAHKLLPVFLSAEEERQYYVGMCNGTLWPLLHYFPGRMESDQRSWPQYEAVNRRFADKILAATRPDDTVWIHDYHLMLLPQLLREQRPQQRIGFFLHVPFPSSEVWRVLPRRAELLRGLLGADYIGFHTADYLRHFRDSCLRVLGLTTSPDAIHSAGRRVGLGVDPLGADVEAFRKVLDEETFPAKMAELESRWPGRRLLLGVERLDYTKGILLKMHAFEHLLERQPERRADTVMLQVLVPSREENESYKTLLREIQREVGRINGRFGTPGRMPLEFLHRSIDPTELAALYRCASACLVTPVRDGMNLVAHEFVLCQGHQPALATAARGSLVLSEFAGAALSLNRSLLVNPWDETTIAGAIEHALAMPPEERLDRIGEMHERVLELDSAAWARRFLRRLARAADHNIVHRMTPLEASWRNRLLGKARASRRRLLFLDYDGTLREIAQRPEHAAPPPELLDLLGRLARLPNTAVHVVSGRRRNTLGTWLGHLPIHLCAEHGFATRAPGGAWRQPGDVDLRWMPRVLELFEQTCEEVPGSFVEKKACGIAWHYRLADPGYGPWRAQDLKQSLEQLLAAEPAETLPGHAVLEVRAAGFDKGNYVRSQLDGVTDDDFVLCAGDDRTDLDMYRVMPQHAFVLHVGGRAEGLANTIATPADLRALLQELARELTITP